MSLPQQGEHKTDRWSLYSEIWRKTNEISCWKILFEFARIVLRYHHRHPPAQQPWETHYLSPFDITLSHLNFVTEFLSSIKVLLHLLIYPLFYWNLYWIRKKKRLVSIKWLSYPYHKFKPDLTVRMVTVMGFWACIVQHYSFGESEVSNLKSCKCHPVL